MKSVQLLYDYDTNLPALPQGYFWRIRRVEPSHLSISILRVRFFGLFASTVATSHVHLNPPAGRMRSNLAWVATRLAEWLATNQEETQRKEAEQRLRNDVAKQLIGDYPPKRFPSEVKVKNES